MLASNSSKSLVMKPTGSAPWVSCARPGFVLAPRTRVVGFLGRKTIATVILVAAVLGGVPRQAQGQGWCLGKVE